MSNLPGVELVGQRQQLVATLLVAPRLGRDFHLQFVDQLVQSFPVRPMGIRTLRSDQITQCRRMLTRIRQTANQTIVVHFQTLAQAIYLGINGMKGTIQFRQGGR